MLDALFGKKKTPAGGAVLGHCTALLPVTWRGGAPKESISCSAGSTVCFKTIC